MSRVASSSCQNNAGSVHDGDHKDYDYASHHTAPFGSNGNETCNTIEAFTSNPEPNKDVYLGHGTTSAKKSIRKHKATAAAAIADIDAALDSETQL